MGLPRITARSLYLLALFQLVAGPLVIIAVLTFARVVVHEAPTQGLAKAVSAAWQSDDVQSWVDVASDLQLQDNPSPSPSNKMQDHGKFTAIVWDAPTILLTDTLPENPPIARLESWTPAWPEAPPGTPPRAA